MNYVSTFEEACAKLGKSSELPDVSSFPEQLQKHITATYKLAMILEVNNGDWKPDLENMSQWKYYPWFGVVKESSGFELSYVDCDCDFAGAFCGARLACKDEVLAEFMGTTFTDLYKDLLS